MLWCSWRVAKWKFPVKFLEWGLYQEHYIFTRISQSVRWTNWPIYCGNWRTLLKRYSRSLGRGSRNLWGVWWVDWWIQRQTYISLLNREWHPSWFRNITGGTIRRNAKWNRWVVRVASPFFIYLLIRRNFKNGGHFPNTPRFYFIWWAWGFSLIIILWRWIKLRRFIFD